MTVIGLTALGIAPAGAQQPIELHPKSWQGGPSSIPSNAGPTIAPRPSTPPGVSDEPRGLLLAARAAVAAGRPGEALEALERAETQLGDRSSDLSRIPVRDNARAALDIGLARRSLMAGDQVAAIHAIDDALGTAAQDVPPPPPEPAETYALQPGHWQLSGADYVWMPPETMLRRVETRALVGGHYAWRDGSWVWVPAHWGD
jgi:hypothetical protein